MSKYLLVALLGVSALACAQDHTARIIVQNPEAFWSRGADNINPRMLTVTKDGEDRVSILDTGDITFGVGATINTNVMLPRAGKCVGYLIVRYNGFPMLIPVHELYPGDTPPKQFDRGTPGGSLGFVERDCYPK